MSVNKLAQLGRGSAFQQQAWSPGIRSLTIMDALATTGCPLPPSAHRRQRGRYTVACRRLPAVGPLTTAGLPIIGCRALQRPLGRRTVHSCP